ncbi:hypothetical protein BWQ96_03678 [Gracilariopsis chorda]|uniref:Uncharacterized protein n=1 Tax=Gracilariopsis chorda TaxID=448386 RepID=A0A2V3IZJ1_9FLOR|nr:hypothetical protein BWQ96_03678 [Gracilariopsis chorda]|eukprot:PXF46550.1 hypothetical protein BWQ96_03678 [Gracilariopsis chorda]
MSQAPRQHSKKPQHRNVQANVACATPPESIHPAPRVPHRATRSVSRALGVQRSHLPSALEIYSRRRVDRTTSVQTEDRSGSAISKPRKRFRKKVSSIFANNTELKKRVEKLFIDISHEELLALAAAPVQPRRFAAKPDTCPLKLPDKALKMLETIANSDEAAAARRRMKNHEGFKVNASKVWGMEKVEEVRKRISSCSPISVQSFEKVFDLAGGKENSLETSTENGSRRNVEPPKRLSVKWFEEDARINGLKSEKPLDRIGIPAVLRKHARRNERGYRIDGRPRAPGGRALKRTRTTTQRRVTPRSADAFQMLVQVATQQNCSEKARLMYEYPDEKGDEIVRSLKKRKLRSS